jgi:uncharacterized protein (DUF362 family)
MPTVAIAHTSQKDRSIKRVYAMVREALEKIGGFEAFVKPGQSVIIKPDQNCAQLAEQGATTDPILVGAIIRLAWEAGASSVTVGAATSGAGDSIECMRATGMAVMAAQEGAKLIDLGHPDTPDREVEMPEAMLLKQARLPVALLDSDVIIGVPKARTDSLDTIAGAIELCKGAMKQDCRYLQTGTAETLGRLADMLTLIRPDLWITDALICGEGDGPNANQPHWAGCVLAASDPVAMDYTIAMLLGRDPSRLRFARAAEERGLGCSAPIVFLGKPLESIAFRAWPTHETFGHLPINVLVGDDVNDAGTVGYIKNSIESLIHDGVLQLALHTSGTPTILIGNVVDSDFETHLQEGPYIVFGDSAKPEYTTDPRVSFIPGHRVAGLTTRELSQILLAKSTIGSAPEEARQLPAEPISLPMQSVRVSATQLLVVALAFAASGVALCMTGSTRQRRNKV